MKAIALGAVLALGIFTVQAQAADLTIPVVDDQTMQMASDPWNGIYAGVGVTGAYNVDFAETFGFLDGIVGANVHADSFVFGAEAYLSGWKSSLAGPGLSAGAEVRGGYLVTPDVLVYMSAGVTHFIKAGGATYGQLGAGVEFAVAQNTTLDLEYKYWHEVGGIYQTHSISASVLWHF